MTWNCGPMFDALPAGRAVHLGDWTVTAQSSGHLVTLEVPLTDDLRNALELRGPTARGGIRCDQIHIPPLGLGRHDFHL